MERHIFSWVIALPILNPGKTFCLFYWSFLYVWTDTSNVQEQIVSEWCFDKKAYDSAVRVSRLAGKGRKWFMKSLQRHSKSYRFVVDFRYPKISWFVLFFFPEMFQIP